MAIEGGERGPNGSPNIFLAIKHDAVTTRNRSRRGGRERIGDLVDPQGRAVHVLRLLEPHRPVPRTGCQRPTRGTSRRSTPPSTRTEGDDFVDVDVAPYRSPGSTASSYENVIGDVRRTQSRSRRAKKYGRAPRRRRVPERRHVDGTVEGPGARLQTPIEGATTSTGTPRESVERSYGTTAVPYAGAARRPWTGMSTRYTPRTRFKNSPGRPSRSPACRHARPERRRRTRRRCPLAITVMRILMPSPSNLLPRDASPGVTRTRSRLAPPSRGALLHVEQFDRVAEDVFRGLDEVVERRLRTNSNPAGAAAARLHPLGPPDGRTRAPLAPWRTPGSPAGLPWRTRCSSWPYGRPNPGNPHRGGSSQA